MILEILAGWFVLSVVAAFLWGALLRRYGHGTAEDEIAEAREQLGTLWTGGRGSRPNPGR